MKKTGIYYGSTTGSTQKVAKMIASKLGIAPADVHDIESDKKGLENYEVLLFGASSQGLGDMQDYWEDFLKVVLTTDLKGKTVALFCCGDSSTYSETFCGAMGKIYEAIKDKGCTIIGEVSTDGYTYDDSEAVVDGKFVGLALDEDNEPNLTEQRINAWVELLKPQL